MVVETKDSQQRFAGKLAPAKRQKTGGRVKKPLDQMLAEARVASELASLNDDTTLPEALAAIYLGISTAELAEHRKPPKKKKAAPAAKAEASDSKTPRLKMIKPIREGAVGQNQKVLYKLGDLRAYQKSITVESSFEAAVNAGIYGFVAIQVPFFATVPKRGERGPAILVGKAWDKLDPEWAKRFRDVVDGNLMVEWMTPAAASSNLWTTVAAHKAFAEPWLKLLKHEMEATATALESTEIGEPIVGKSVLPGRTLRS